MKEDTSKRVRSHLQKTNQSEDFIQSDGVKDLEKREAKFCSAAAMLAGNLGEHFRKSNIISCNITSSRQNSRIKVKIATIPHHILVFGGIEQGQVVPQLHRNWFSSQCNGITIYHV